MLLCDSVLFLGLRRNPYCFSRGRTRQSVIPHGHHGNGFEKYLILAVALVTLVFAVWRYWGSRR